MPESPDVPDDPIADRWFYPRGTLADGGWDVVVGERLPGWRHTGLRVADLPATGRSGAGDGARGGVDLRRTGLSLPAAEMERLVVPLHGSFAVEILGTEATTYELPGRASVFDGPTDTLYLPPGTDAVIRGSGRVAVAEASSSVHRPIRHLARTAASVELRGRGRASRQVHDLGTPAVLDAERLIVCEVITPAGNWSSYPPHKHDEHHPGRESRLEEIYYFEVAPSAVAITAAADAIDPLGVRAADAFAMFTACSSPAVEIELDVRVRTGDVALIPGGYHGPAAAAPGYDLYYLNVMAGPDARVWEITDDPRHAWIRDTWASEEVDSRLPFTTETNGAHR